MLGVALFIGDAYLMLYNDWFGLDRVYVGMVVGHAHSVGLTKKRGRTQWDLLSLLIQETKV